MKIARKLLFPTISVVILGMSVLIFLSYKMSNESLFVANSRISSLAKNSVATGLEQLYEFDMLNVISYSQTAFFKPYLDGGTKGRIANEEDSRGRVVNAANTYSYARVGLADTSGKILVDSNKNFEGVSISNEPFFKNALAGGISTGAPYSYDGKMVYTIASPVYGEENSQVIGVVFIVSFLGEEEIIKKLNLGENDEFFIADSAGTIFVHNEGARNSVANLNNLEIGKKIIGQNSGSFLCNTLGLEEYVSFSFLSGLNWYVVIVNDVYTIETDSRKIGRNSIWIAIFVTAIVSLVIVLIVRRIAFATKSMAEFAEYIAAGNFELTERERKDYELFLHRRDEISTLAENLIVMANSLGKMTQESNEKTQQAEMAQRYTQDILDIAPTAIVIWDKQGKIRDINKETLRLFKCSSKEEFLASLNKIIVEHQPNGELTAPLMQKLFDKVFAGESASGEFVAYNLEGQEIPHKVHLELLHAYGEALAIAYIFDLREIKAMLTEIESTNENLRTARDIAERNSKYKSEFLANMSHEIRTPLNGVLGLLHLLSGTELQAVQQEYLQKSIYSAENLLRIINDILDFSKIEAGKLELEETTFSLNSVVEKLRAIFEHKMIEKSITAYTNLDEFAGVKLVGDPLRLEQVLINIIGNAIKFTEKGSVTFSIECAKENESGKELLCCKFSVRDTGIGLTEEQKNRLFSAFIQADTSVTRKHGGTGLGLAISKQIVELMHGTIWVESEFGKGSEFCFTATFELYNENNAAHNKLASASPKQFKQIEASTQKTAQILLVEDNQINQLVAKGLLKKAGYSVDIANDGQEALDMLDQKEYDLVFMDIQMPVMDGLTATKNIRSQERFKNLPIIAMSAHAMQEDKEKSIAYGMNDHITKPISPSILFETLETWIGKA